MINILSENNSLEKVLEFWLNKTNSSQFEVQKNKILLAIMSLITLNPQHQNPTITKNIKFLLDSLICFVKEKYNDFEDNMEEVSEKTNFELEDEENHKNNEVRIIICRLIFYLNSIIILISFILCSSIFYFLLFFNL